MENNKAYLQKIPWVALIAFLHTLIIFIVIPWIFDSYRNYEEQDTLSRNLQIILYNILPLSFYVSLGIVTSHWKAAGIAAAVYVGVELIYWFVFRNTGSSSTLADYFKQQFILSFLFPIPTLVFAAVHIGLTKKLWIVCVTILIFSMAFSLDTSSINGQNLLSFLDNFEFRDGWGIAMTLLSIIVRVALYIGEVIVVCELMNIGFGKTYINMPTLLNLGNDYNKASNIFTFWALKLCLFVVIFAAAAIFSAIMLSMGDRYEFSNSNDGGKYFLFSSFLKLLSYTGLALFLAWYIRKFLLETFVNFGIHSKFLYWFSYLPIIGFFGFLVVQLENMKQEKYSQKVQSLGTFASSSAAGVTGVIFFLMGLRLIVELANGNAAFIVAAIVGAGLFVWLITSKIGYQVSFWLVTAGLCILLLMGLTSGASREREQELYSIMFAFLLANIVSLILIYPVYHFEEFQYMPSEDPNPVAPGDPEFSLFP